MGEIRSKKKKQYIITHSVNKNVSAHTQCKGKSMFDELMLKTITPDYEENVRNFTKVHIFSRPKGGAA